MTTPFDDENLEPDMVKYSEDTTSVGSASSPSSPASPPRDPAPA